MKNPAIKKIFYSLILWGVLVFSMFFFFESKEITKSALQSRIKEEVEQYYKLEEQSPVLGVYNAVTLTPSPEPKEEKVASTSNQNSQKVQSYPTPTLQPIAVSIDRSSVYSQINSYRQANGLAPVDIDSRLEVSASNKAKDMVNKNYFEHGNPWQFINGAGYSFNYAAENLAINYFSTNSLINGWKNSPSHNQAMLDERNQHMGFSFICQVTVDSYANTCLSVVHFAREN